MTFFHILLVSLAVLLAVVNAELAHVQDAVQKFMQWYLPNHGLWIGHISYAPDWCRGNGMEALANYLYYYGNGNQAGNPQISKDEEEMIWNVMSAVQDNQGTRFYQTADYFDDVLWWCLAYTRAYEVSMRRGDTSRASRYLTTALDIYDVVTRDSWSDSPCGGGVFWSRDFSYKNAITNELYFTAGARLGVLTSNSTYSDRAMKTYNWLMNSGMLGSDSLIMDGLSNATCAPTGGVYTYNQGVLLGGMVELNRLQSQPSMIDVGVRITNAVKSKMTNADGVLTESSCGDGALFKGIYTRYLRYFIDSSLPENKEDLKQFLVTQSKSVWHNARDTATGFVGKSWSGPADYKYHNLQISAIDALTSSGELFVEPNQRDNALICGAHGKLIGGVCVCDIRYSGDHCRDETSWESYFNGASVTLTSTSTGRLLCEIVSSSGTASASTCFSDSSASQSTFTVINPPGTSYVQLVAKDGQLLSVDQTSNTVRFVSKNTADLSSTYFTAKVSFDDKNHISELVSFVSYNQKFIGLSSDVQVEAFDSSNQSEEFRANFAQRCQ